MGSDDGRIGSTQEKKSFLIGEERLEAVEEDAFGHKAHVETLEDIVKEVTTPWHIALYGTWGAGKSTIVNLLYKRIRASQASDSEYEELNDNEIPTQREFQDTLCVSFNAWKHAEDSIRTELLLDLNQSLQEELNLRFGIDPEREPEDADVAASEDDQNELYGRTNGVLGSERIINTLYNVEERSNEKTNGLKQTITNIDDSIIYAVATLSVLAVFYFVVSVSSLPFREALMSGMRTFGLALVGIGLANALFGVVLEEVRDSRKDVDRTLANPQTEWSGAYENLFNAIIDAADKQYQDRQQTDDPRELKRVVITVDDLDRCQSQTTYEILIALKSFLSHDICVYIIPCDEDALYKHLEAADQGDYLGDTVNQQNFLAKFFETELEIPTPSDSRLADYFDNRQKQFDRSFDSRSLEILRAAELNTPRRVTRALNRLVVLEELGSNRGVIDDERVRSEVNTPSGSTEVDDEQDEWDPGRAFLAFVSILQKDYPRFHAELERDPDLLTEVFEELGGGFSTGDRQGLDPLLDEIHVPEDRRDPLLAFLTAAQDVAEAIESPEPYLRLSGERPDPTEIFKARFDRNRIESLRTFVQEHRVDPSEELNEDNDGNDMDDDDDDGRQSTEITEAEIQTFVSYVERKVRDETTQFEALPTAIGIADIFDTDQQRQIAEAVLSALENEQPSELLGDIELSSMEPILSVLSQAKIREFLRLYVQSIVGDDGLRTENFASLIDGPGKPFEDEATQQAFTETIRSARRRGVLSDEAFARILADVRTGKPELYTPELVACK